MPLPWNLPTLEEADELYRRIDQLITDLYHLIRSILFGPPPIPEQQEPPDPEEDNTVPDLLAELGSSPAPQRSNTDAKQDDPRPPMR